MKKYLITLATIVTLILLNSNCIEASYDRNKASDYAQKYSQDPNTYFYTLVRIALILFHNVKQ